MFRTWLTKRFAPKKLRRLAGTPRRSAAKAHRLRLEELESRTVPTTITRTSAPIFYNDLQPPAGATPFTSEYASYQITNNDGVNYANVWVTIGNFTAASGPVVVTLATNGVSAINLGPLANGATKTAFFYLGSNADAITVSQTHTVSVYNGSPTAGTLLASQNFSFTASAKESAVQNTIAASANKVTAAVTSPSPPTLGGIFTITVTGQTGTIGTSGGTGGTQVLDFTPAAYSSWRADAYQLVGSTITLSGGNTGTFTDTLLIPPESITSSADTSYTAVYTLQAVGAVATPTAVNPTAYISSGTQTKHTDHSSFATLPPVQPPLLASPALSTAPTPDTVPLGATPVTLTDSATLANGFRPTGILTFTLFRGGTLVDTETVAVNGNGTYKTPTGFTLPSSGTATGTYQWDASYSGDPNNHAASDNDAADEQVTVSAAPPVTPEPTTTTLTASPTAILFGQSVTLTAQVTGAPVSPFPGSVTFFNGPTALGTAPVNPGTGTATLTFTPPTAGTFQLVALFTPASNNFAASASAAVSVTVIAQQAVGVFNPFNETWFLKNSSGPGAPDIPPFQYGGFCWDGLTGDWTGSGQDTIAVVDPTTMTWYIRFSNSAGPADIPPFQFGAPFSIPLAGDWNGGGKDTIAVVDPATMTWYVKFSIGPGAPDIAPFHFGPPGSIPVAGDWNGTGHTGIGAFDPKTGVWYLRNEVGPGPSDAGQFAFGPIGATPVVGDWAGNGKSTVAAFDSESATWYIRFSNSAGAPDVTPFSFGGPQYEAFTGHWQLPADPAPAGSADPPPDPNSAYVQSLYRAFLNRSAGAGEVGFWVGVLGTSGRAAVATGITHSPEYFTRLVDGYYTNLLGRAADAGGEASWVNKLLTGASEESVLAGFLSSPEFFNLAQTKFRFGSDTAGSPDQVWVEALYRVLLGRSGSAADVSYWLSRLSTSGLAGVVNGFVGSSEFRQTQVETYYDVNAPVGLFALPAHLLNRTTPASPSELSFWAGSAQDLLSIQASIAASDEFFTNGRRAAGG